MRCNSFFDTANPAAKWKRRRIPVPTYFILLSYGSEVRGFYVSRCGRFGDAASRLLCVVQSGKVNEIDDLIRETEKAATPAPANPSRRIGTQPKAGPTAAAATGESATANRSVAPLSRAEQDALTNWAQKQGRSCRSIQSSSLDSLIRCAAANLSSVDSLKSGFRPDSICW